MSEKTLQCKAEEVAACCCVDVGTIIDNSDLSVNVEAHFANKEEAENALESLKNKANKAAFSGYELEEEIIEDEQGAKLKAVFTFECQAESMIFQLANR